MKKWLFLLIVFSCTNFLIAQTFDGGEMNNLIIHIPSDQTISTTNIAEYVKKNFDSDIKKVSAIYSWVTANIRYDKDSANIINLGPDPEAKITAALRRRRGVCENYAAIFNDICIKSGLTSIVIDGYTKQNGFVDRTGHAWCAVLINNTWLLYDPTWDAGADSNTKYFMVQPSEFIQTHIPFDPMWQLLNADSIAAYSKMDSLHQLQSAAYRVERGDLNNALVKDHLNFLRMHIEMIRQDKDVDLYNSSVADLNNATTIYNNFVQFRNKQFTPSIPDEQLQAMLDGIDIKLNQAHKKLAEIDRSPATFTFSTEVVRDRLNALTAKVKEQKDFLMQYLNTAKTNRQALFYKQVTIAGK